MREVGRKTVSALKARKYAKVSRNTRVETGHVFLHGSVIATYEPERKRLHVTLAGWNTPTTRSRVNDILSGFGVRGGFCCVNYELRFWDGSQPTAGEVATRAVSPREVLSFDLPE